MNVLIVALLSDIILLLLEWLGSDSKNISVLILQSSSASNVTFLYRCCFLIFSSLRGSLKLQLEQYLSKLVTLIGSESNRISYQHKELALGIFNFRFFLLTNHSLYQIYEEILNNFDWLIYWLVIVPIVWI